MSHLGIPDDGPAGSVEHLDSHGPGRPRGRQARTQRRRHKPVLLAGAGVVGLGLVVGAAGAAWWWFADGPQAAEAFPSSSLGYVGLTLDPSGGQQLEALRTLQRFPVISAELDLEGDARDVDVKETLGSAVLDSAPCQDLDYDQHLRPWLGDRVGLAALLVDGDPQPVLAVESTDDVAAAQALPDLVDCGAAGDPETVFELRSGWVLLAPDQDVMDQTLADLEAGTLAEDEDFARWTEEAGDPGIMTMYAAPAAGPVVLDLMQSHADATYAAERTRAARSVVTTSGEPAAELPDELAAAFEDFEGAGAQLRFRDGGLELELAGSAGEGAWSQALSDGAGDLVAALPTDTGLVYAYGLGEAWVEPLFAYVESDPSLGLAAGDLEELMRSELGLEGSDLEAALGGSAALVVGSDVDVDAVEAGDFASIPIALLSSGEEAAVQRVVDAVNPLLGGSTDLLGVSAGEDRIAVGADTTWTDEVAEGGGFAQRESVRDVLPDLEDSIAVTYFDLDALAQLVAETMQDLGEDSTEVMENLEPLAAFGTSSRIDEEGVVRGLLRLTTDQRPGAR